MNADQFQPSTIVETPSSPRYAFVSSPRLQRQSSDSKLIHASRADEIKSLKQIESQKRVRRQIQSVQPYEYTIYLAPDIDTEDEQIESIYPNGASNPSQTVSCQSDILEAIHSIQKNDQIPHTDYSHQRSCSPCAYLPAIQTSLPKISTNNQISTVVPNSNPLHSCSPQSQNTPLSPTASAKSTPICQCPSVEAHPPANTISIPLSTVPTSTVLPLPTTTISSIVTATTPAPLVTTSNPSKSNLHELCQNHNKTGTCSVMIQKAIILYNGDQNTTNLSSIVNAFRNLNYNDNDNDFEDLQESDDVSILDGKDLLLSPSRKSPSIELKIIDLLEKVHRELQISNQRNSESISDDIDDIEPNKEDSKKSEQCIKTIRDPNEQNVKKCETGKDFVEACKNLSKTISSYQRPV